MSHPFDRMIEDPGGMECEECGVIFIGAEYHRICAVCAGIDEPPSRVQQALDQLEQKYRQGAERRARTWR